MSEGSGRWVRLGTALGVAPLVALGAGVEVGWAARVGAVVATGRGLVAAGDCGAFGVGLAAAAGPAGDSTARPATQAKRASAETRRAEGVGTARRLRSTGVLPGVNRWGQLCVVGSMGVATVAVGGVALAERAPEAALTDLYAAHYARLVRTAAFLTSDRDTAEEIVQDAFVALHTRWVRVRDPQAYLHTAVLNLSRSRLRRRLVAGRFRPEPVRDADSAETGALGLLLRRDLAVALGALPRRQREAIVLRYYADLSEAQTAAAMGCSAGAVKSHTSRAMTALRHLLEDRP